ncbi:MAG: S1C family serine protease [Acidimicrobiia bacterium]
MTDGDPRTPEPNEQQLFPPPWPTARPPEPPLGPPTEPNAALPPLPPAPPYGPPAQPTPPAPKSRRVPALMALVGVVALVAGAAGATIGVAVTDRSSTAPSTSSFLPPGASNNDGNGSSNGDLVPGFGSSDSGSGSSGSNADIDVNGIASKVNPAIVNIATELTGGQEAAGSGMVLTSSGEVLTNNHVINGATKIQVEVGVTGKTYSAKVLGYDSADDVALIKLNNASGMKTITAADASSVSRNDAVVAIGNALGKFGTPAAVAGSVTALHQRVTAGDGLDSETLSDMIRIAASIQPGDSGGALVNGSGKVIGMNTAADSGSGRFGYRAGTTGFAIPIGNALKIVDEIKAGDSSNGAHIGDRALLGVVLQDSSSGSADVPFGSNGGGSDVTGAAVTDVGSGTPAESAGIGSGDTITAVGQHTIRSTDDLRSVLDDYHPGDKVNVAWTDANGDSHHASVTLTKGPPA